MPLYKVTATGPNDLHPVDRIARLLLEFPKAEIGILYSGFTGARFPSIPWIDDLYDIVSKDKKLQGRFAFHACGGPVKDFLMGNILGLLQKFAKYKGMFSRLQINTHGMSYTSVVNLPAIEVAVKSLSSAGIEVILQRDGVNDFVFDHLCQQRGITNISTLFDTSAGAGLLPPFWPQAIPKQMCGYAGGLSPENVAANILKIEAVCPQDFWIDAEGQLMADDGYLSLSKVESYFRNAGA